MKPTRVSRLSLLVFVPVATLAHAHPGHDGHELTWDFGHLAAHPFSTSAGLLAAGALGWAVWKRIQRAGAARAQSFRASQPSRGR